MDYPVTLTPDDNDTFLVTCSDLPEVTSFGETEAEALSHAADAIEEAIAARLARFVEITLPGQGEPRVAVSLQTSVKVHLYATSG